MSYDPGFKPLGPDFVIIPEGPSPIGGDIHESFNTDRNGNLFDGHTTIRIPGGQDINIPWSP